MSAIPDRSTGLDDGTVDHPWEIRVPGLWRFASQAASVLVAGFLVTIGIGLPVVLPVALAGAFRIAVRRARGQAVHPLSDALAGIREDWASVAVLVAVLAVGVAPIAWLVGIGLAEATGLTAGVRFGLALGCATALGPLVLGCTIASATATPARMVPRAAVGIALAAPGASLKIVLAMVLGLVPILLDKAEALLPATLGVAVLVATSAAWQALQRTIPAADGD